MIPNMPKVLLFDVNETLLDLGPLKKRIGADSGTGPQGDRNYFDHLGNGVRQ